MNIWPPDELWKTILIVGVPVLLSPRLVLLEIIGLFSKFANQDIITIREFSRIGALALFVFIASVIIISFCYKIIADTYKDKSKNIEDKLYIIIFGPVLGYGAISVVSFLLLKFFKMY